MVLTVIGQKTDGPRAKAFKGICISPDARQP
jgi:hypothetical protein